MRTAATRATPRPARRLSDRAPSWLPSSCAGPEVVSHATRERAMWLGQVGTVVWTGVNLRYDCGAHLLRSRRGVWAMPLATETNGPLRFSTGGLAVPDRIEAIRRLRDRGILPIEPLPDRAVHVRIAKWG